MLVLRELIISLFHFIDLNNYEHILVVTLVFHSRILRHICGCLQRTVAKRWPDNEIVKPRVVSGFIFLRLLCPTIVNPRIFNLVTEPPAESAGRTLKLVAKSLINLANLVEVGTKEIYMEAVGPFIVDNKNRMVTFLNELAVSRFLLTNILFNCTSLFYI